MSSPAAEPGVIGIGPYKIPPAMYAENRTKLVARLRASIPAERHGGAAAVFEGGKESFRHDTDHEHLFRNEDTFLYLFGVNEPGFYGAVCVASGRSLLFAPRLDETWELWAGKRKPLEWYAATYGVDECHYADEMAGVLRAAGVTAVHTMRGVNTDSGSECKPAAFEGKDAFEEDQSVLYADVVECRVIKSERELEVMRYVVGLASAAHIGVMQRIRPGMHEYQLESLFKHHCSFHGGSRYEAYTAICGCGANGAVLHYGHAGAPNDGVIKEEHMCLLDMGCEYHGLCSDVTCSFPASGTFSDDQRWVYEAVLAAHNAVEAAMRPGVAWPDMHALAERHILEGLVAAGVVLPNGRTAEQLRDELNLASFFMPHGLGHLIGYSTHDVGGYPAGGPARPARPGAKNLRTARDLERGMCITIEPGLYFIEAVLARAKADPAVSAHLNWDAIDRLRTFGGVRIESDVAVTADGCENLTKVPRTVADVEACMAEGRKKYGDRPFSA